MDSLLAQFQTLCESHLSSFDILCQLSKGYPDIIQGGVTCLGRYNNGQKLYSAKISFDNGPSFNGTNLCPNDAVGQVMQQAYDYLQREAQKTSSIFEEDVPLHRSSPLAQKTETAIPCPQNEPPNKRHQVDDQPNISFESISSNEDEELFQGNLTPKQPPNVPSFLVSNQPDANQLAPLPENRLSLNQRDQRIISILNRFNKVFNHNKSPLAIMNETLKTNKTIGIVTNKVNDNYQVLVKVGLYTFSSIKSSAKKARKDALLEYFKRLKKLSELFVTFKSVHKPLEMPVRSIMKLIKKTNKDCIKIYSLNDTPFGDDQYRTTITIDQLIDIVEYGPTQLDSYRNATTKLIEYLQRISTMIVNSPLMEGSLLQDEKPLRGQLSATMQKVSSPSVLPIVPTTKLPSVVSQVDNKEQLLPRDYQLIVLISLFKKINKFNKKPLELINEIANAGIKRFQIGTQRTGDSFFTTHCKIDNFGTFYGTSSTETGSREMVLSQLYETLANIANLFETVKLVYSPFKSSSEFISNLISLHSKLIQVQAWSIDSVFHLVIAINHVRQYHETAASESEARMTAFEKMTQFLRKFSLKMKS